MSIIFKWLLVALFILVGAPLARGFINKCKAHLQGRVGSPLSQPLLDIIKLFQKHEVVSELSSWVFRGSALINFVVLLMLAVIVPWLSFKPEIAGADIFLVVYLLGLLRFMSVLAALDAGSVFGGFGASREVTVAILVEPAIILALVSLGSLENTSDLVQIFSFKNQPLTQQSGIWVLSGLSLFLASIAELCRMPVDDPTTHLELTMVHEAMVIENSGPNLAFVQYGYSIKLLVLLGLSAQCFLHAIPNAWTWSSLNRGLADVAIIGLLLFLVALGESTQVKMRWTKLQEHLAYAVVLGMFGAFLAVWRA